MPHDFRDVRPPEVEIEFRDGEIDGVATVGDHLLKIRCGVFDVSEAVVADGCLRDGHGLLLLHGWCSDGVPAVGGVGVPADVWRLL